MFFLYILLFLTCRSHIDVVTSPAPPQGVRVGGVTPLYKPYMFVPPQRVRRFGRSVYHFGLESGMVFVGITGVYEGIVVSILNE